MSLRSHERSAERSRAGGRGSELADFAVMRVLVYGAGNIGSLYAAKLAQNRHDVSVLARGQRVESLRKAGIELEDGLSGKRSKASVRVLERLEAHDTYDLVLVVLPKHRISEAMPALAANDCTPNVMFFGNNVAGPEAMVHALGSERVLLGFPGAAAIPRDGAIRYVITSAREQPTTVGELDGRASARIAEMAVAFDTAGFPAAVCPNMDAWLKTHAAEILPTVGALFLAGVDPAQLASDAKALRLMVSAIREGYQVLGANAIPIIPTHHRLFTWAPEAVLRFITTRMLRSESTAIKIGHAEKGRAEWQRLAAEFRVLMERVDVPTPSTDVLFGHVDGPVAAEPALAS